MCSHRRAQAGRPQTPLHLRAHSENKLCAHCTKINKMKIIIIKKIPSKVKKKCTSKSLERKKVDVITIQKTAKW